MQKAELAMYESRLYETALPWFSNDDDSVSWHHYSGTSLEDGILYKGSTSEYGTIFKCQVILHCSAEEIFHSIGINGNTSWTPNLGDFQMIEKTDAWNITYTRAKGQSGISDRDFVNIRFNQRRESGEYCVLGCSLDTVPKLYKEKLNLSKKVVRGQTNPGGFVWTQLNDPNKCLSTYIYNVDLKGYLPKSLINLVVPNFVLRFCKAVQTFSDNFEQSDVCKEKENRGQMISSSGYEKQILKSPKIQQNMIPVEA